MSQVSRPMQIALAATLLLAVVWFVALRPKPSGDGASAASPAPAATQPGAAGAAPGVAGLKGAIDKAHGAVATASGDAQRAAQSSADGAVAGAPKATAPAASASATPDAGHGSRAAAGADHASAGGPAASGAGHPSAGASAGAAPAAHPGVGRQVAAVQSALRHHKAVAIAFVDLSTADGQAVAQEMGRVSRFGGRALALAVPLSQLSAYAFIANPVQVTVAPTIAIVDPRGHATTIVGFADGGEIQQRLADALASRR